MAQEGMAYYVGYHMIVESLKEDGYTHALDLIRTYLKAKGCYLFKKDKDKYNLFVKENDSKNNSLFVNVALNRVSEKIGEKEYMELSLEGGLDLLFVPINTKNSNYVLAISNNNLEDKESLDVFIEIVKHSLSVVLEKQEEYEIIKKSSYEDTLTELYNRNSYENRMLELGKEDKQYTYVYVDLFRLKYMNDNFGYEAGDKYIKGAAKILKKHFPQYKVINGKQEEIGNKIYRFGGDEFVIISLYDNPELIEQELIEAQEEIKSLDLGVDSSVPLGLNYGMAVKGLNEEVDIVKEKAHKALDQNKREMYTSLGLDRRR